MINLTVISVKDLFRYLVGLIITIVLVITLTRYFLMQKNLNLDIADVTSKQMEKLNNYSSTHILDTTLSIVKQVNNEDDALEKETTSRGTELKRILNSQLGIFESMNNQSETLNELPNADVEQVSAEIDTDISTNLETQVIDEKNIKENYTNTLNSVKIKNKTKFALTEELLNAKPEVKNKQNILIFHSHTCESYTQTDRFNYQMTGNYRTNDLNYSIARVGKELQLYLKEYGYNVNHNTTYHDYPAYSGSYSRSLETVKNVLNNNSDLEIVFDLHRDAVGDGTTYGPTVKIGDEIAAQLMFVIGTNGGGLEHPNWQENFKFAIAIQKKADELYPGLFRPIILTDARYNQHTTKAASIIEVGATANTMEQSLISMKYLSKVIDEVLKEI